MRQRTQRFPKEGPVGHNIGRANHQHVVKTARDHVALLNFRVALNGAIKVRQRARPGVFETNFNKGHMGPSQLDRIEDRAISADDPEFFQAFQSRLTGRF